MPGGHTDQVEKFRASPSWEAPSCRVLSVCGWYAWAYDTGVLVALSGVFVSLSHTDDSLSQKVRVRSTRMVMMLPSNCDVMWSGDFFAVDTR